MKGEMAREIGSPDYRHPSRTDADFDDHIDDFSIAVIALSLKAIALNPKIKTTSSDTLLLYEKDYRTPNTSSMLAAIQQLSADSVLSMLLGVFYISLAKNSLDSISFRLFITDKPNQSIKVNVNSASEKIDTSCTDKDIEEGVKDIFGVVYSKDGKRLLRCTDAYSNKWGSYEVKEGTEIICDYAFSINKIKKITLPNTVKAIGERTFNESDLLEEINIPDSVIFIGKHAFAECYALNNITIPPSVKFIKENPFLGNVCLGNLNVKISIDSNKYYSLVDDMLIDSNGNLISCLNDSEYISIPNGVHTISHKAFHACGLKEISIPDSVTSIGDNAFEGCALLQKVYIDNSVISIGDFAFNQCSSLREINLPDTLKIMGYRAFNECYSLKCLCLPKSLEAIKGNPFAGCDSLRITSYSNPQYSLINNMLIDNNGRLISCLNNEENITIPSCVSTIGNSAFSGCRTIHNINIPSSVTIIENYAFENCKSIKKIDIPDSVKLIGELAFWNECLEFDIKVYISKNTRFTPPQSSQLSLFSFGEIKIIRK